MNGYDLSRNFWNWAFDNPEKISPNHAAIFFFAIEHCNRLGWKDKFGLPTTMVMEAVGIKSYNTYIKVLNELIGFGFIKMIEKSKNQYSANIIALSKNDKALNKALDKAMIKHVTKQSESTIQSNDSIIKQETIKPINHKQINNDFNEFLELFSDVWLEDIAMKLSVSAKKLDELKEEFIKDRQLDKAYNEQTDAQLRSWFINFVKRNKGTPPKTESKEERNRRFAERLKKDNNL